MTSQYTQQNPSGASPAAIAAILAGVLLVTFLVYRPVLHAEFLNWDDNAHLTENPYIRSLSSSDLHSIFTKVFNNTYIPLTMLSFAVEYHWAGYDAAVFHRDNLIGHLIVTTLVFWLSMLMSNSLGASAMAALIFGIHPMHVEAVAWVTARKDVLYGTFYLLAMIAYYKYCQSGRNKFFILTWFCGLLSILAKPMGLSLPLVLLILDWFTHRRWEWRILAEKIIFLVYTVPIVYLTYVQIKREALFSIPQGFLNWIWSFTFYLKQFFFPNLLLPLYRLPFPHSIFNPEYGIACLLMVIILAGLWIMRRQRWVVFAGLFYTASIFYMCRFSRFDPMIDKSVVADRFMYLASFGICFALGVGIDHLWRVLGARYFVIGKTFVLCLIIVFSFMGIKTYRQTLVWNNSLSLWNYALDHPSKLLQDSKMSAQAARLFYANRAVALTNRGLVKHEQGKFDEAMADYNAAISYNAFDATAHNNRGLLYQQRGYIAQAMNEFQLAIQLDPLYAAAYINRGVVSATSGRSQDALNDFNRAIMLQPEYPYGFLNRGNWLRQHGVYEQALKDVNQALVLKKDFPEAYYLRSRIFLALGKMEQAREDARQSERLGYKIPQRYHRELWSDAPQSGQ